MMPNVQATTCLKQTKLSFKKISLKMGQLSVSAFNKWKNVQVAGFQEYRDLGII